MNKTEFLEMLSYEGRTQMEQKTIEIIPCVANGETFYQILIADNPETIGVWKKEINRALDKAGWVTNQRT